MNSMILSAENCGIFSSPLFRRRRTELTHRDASGIAAAMARTRETMIAQLERVKGRRKRVASIEEEEEEEEEPAAMSRSKKTE